MSCLACWGCILQSSITCAISVSVANCYCELSRQEQLQKSAADVLEQMKCNDYICKVDDLMLPDDSEIVQAELVRRIARASRAPASRHSPSKSAWGRKAMHAEMVKPVFVKPQVFWWSNGQGERNRWRGPWFLPTFAVVAFALPRWAAHTF